MKILVVDDSPTIRAALKALLERMGHTVAEANDGKKALHMYRQDRPGLVLIDVVMPVMDGYEAARHMRETSAEECADHFPELEGSRSGTESRDRGRRRRLSPETGELRRAEREDPGAA